MVSEGPPLNPHAGQCRATAKSTGLRCRRVACGPTGLCTSHGGRQRSGLAHPNTKHGRYSKHVPNILADAERTRNDPELLDLGLQLSVNELRYRGAVETADEFGASLDILQRAHAATADALQADRTGDAEGRTAALRRVQHALASGIGRAEAWGEVDDLAERKARLVTAEVKRRRELDKGGLGAEELTAITVMMMDAIRDTFEEFDIPRAAFGRIAERFNAVFRPYPQRPTGLLGPGA